MSSRKRSRALSTILFVLLMLTPAFAQGPREIRITANEFSFKPAKIQVPPGEVKFVVTNRGKFLHGLAIVGRDEQIKSIESGESQSLTLKFDKAEELVFYCPQPGHRRKGMEGTLKVGGR